MSFPPTESVPGAAPDAAASPQQPVLSYAAPAMEGVVLTSTALEMLRLTRPWVTFMGTVLVVVGVVAALVGLIGGIVAISRSPAGAVQMFLYVLLSLVYIFPGIYLRQYAARIRDLLNMRRSEDLEGALEAQKSFWRLVGVMTAIILGIYVVILAIAGIAIALR